MPLNSVVVGVNVLRQDRAEVSATIMPENLLELSVVHSVGTQEFNSAQPISPTATSSQPPKIANKEVLEGPQEM
mgnify:CR=1 FL=1